MRFLPGFEGSAFAPGGFADPMTTGRIIKTELRNFFPLSFRGDAKRRTRNLEIPGLALRTIPE